MFKFFPVVAQLNAQVQNRLAGVLWNMHGRIELRERRVLSRKS